MNREYKEKLSGQIEKNFSDLEMRILEDIVRRIKKAGEITSTADYQINRLQILGNSSEEIERMIKQTLEATYPQMFELYDKVIDWEYVRNKDIYEQINAEFIPYEENEELQQITNALIQQTDTDLHNITKSLGFCLNYGNGKRVLTPLAQIYQKYLDDACMDIVTGAFDYNSVLRRVVTQLTNSGLRKIDYASGWSNRVDVAARRAIMTGITQLTGNISDMNAKKLETDFFEIAWHSGARPSHAVWQGRVWSSNELVSVCGLGTVTGLEGANCYHERYPFIPGISKRLWTDEWLEEQNLLENTPKTFNGKEYTLYEAKQQQRKMETAMRAQRQKVKLLQNGGADPDDVMIAKAKYQGQLNEYARFSKKMGLPQERERIYYDISGRTMSKTRQLHFMKDMNVLKDDKYTKGLSRGSMLQRCQRANEINDNYTTRKSKWSGEVIVDDKKCKKEKISGRKLWSCDILLSSKCHDRTIIHEDLHARSGSYLNPLTYISYGKMEEASVELLAREICKAEGIPFVPNKNKNVDKLYEINQIVNICDNSLDFAEALFAKDLRRRYEWLSKKVQNHINENSDDVEKLQSLLSSLKGSKL